MIRVSYEVYYRGYVDVEKRVTVFDSDSAVSNQQEAIHQVESMFSGKSEISIIITDVTKDDVFHISLGLKQ